MSDLEPVPDGVHLARGEADLATAARQLRAVPPSRRSVEIADRVLERTLATPRRSRLVRVPAPHDHVRVSTTAITAVLREHLDAHLVGAAVGRVVLDVDRDGELTGVLVELYVKYGTDVLVSGDRARALAGEAMAQVLGPASGALPAVRLSHVHVADVTIGDPHLVDPSDE